MVQPTWIGHVLGGRYKIEALLGQGGMSAVYKANDPNLKRVVAVKLIHSHLSTDTSFVQRFEAEAAAVASLRHPNIVQVFDFNHDGGTYYMVLEFIPGETLHDRLERLVDDGRRLSIDEALKFSADIADAVGYAHQRGMVHRDIKPANIMLDVHGQAILMDFGIVKMMGGESHTNTGAVVGTARYMPPELARGETADLRSDIYSLGVTLYEMLSGRPPFVADSAMTLMMMHLNDPVPDVRGFRPDIDPGIVAILEKCLAKNPNDRYQSAKELTGDLKRSLSALGGKTEIAAQPVAAAMPDVNATMAASKEKSLPQGGLKTEIRKQPAPKLEAAVPAKKRSLRPVYYGLGGLAVLVGCVVLGVSLFRNVTQKVGATPAAGLQTESPLSSRAPVPFKPNEPPTKEATLMPTVVSAVEVIHLVTPSADLTNGRIIFDVESVDTSPEKRAPYGDSYEINLLERPFQVDMTYVPDLDISTFDITQTPDWYYVSINLVGTDPNNALGINYGVELDIDRDGFGDFLIVASPPYAPEWETKTVRVYVDANKDTAGESPKTSDAPIVTDGYETLVFDGIQGLGDDPDLAWVRHPNETAVQFAFKRTWAGESFLFGVLADAFEKDVTKYDYTDRFTAAEAGSPMRRNPEYPLKALYSIDTTCRSAFGFSSTGYEPRICPVIVQPVAGQDNGSSGPAGCQPPGGACDPGFYWWPDPHCACSTTPYNGQ